MMLSGKKFQRCYTLKAIFQKFRFRKIMLALSDAFIIALSAFLSGYFTVLMKLGISVTMLAGTSFVSVLTCISCLTICGAYNKLWRYFNSKDYLSCITGVLGGIFFTALSVYLIRGGLPWHYFAMHLLISTSGICLFRLIFKTAFIDIIKIGRDSSVYKRTMIIGGGSACEMLMNEIKNARSSSNKVHSNTALFEPVCIIDDDSSKLGRLVGGVQVVGNTSEIKRFIKQMNIEQIIFCIPSCSEYDRKRILDICSGTELPIKVIPFIGQALLNDKGSSMLNMVRDIKVEDLLGREPVRFDNKDIRDFISGKVCMVTGGGGSIGSELVRQIVRYSPELVVIVDIYENNAYDIQQELNMEYGGSIKFVTVIASVRDYFRMEQIFSEYAPDIVFHAAAHKHVPLMEGSPVEAIKNNVIGTFNVATLSQFHNVEKFVMISTDKAVNPTNVMGASKRCCEMIVQYLAQQHGGKTEFVTTRFGNVLGSNGSVIPLFKRQIEQGKPVTVTHPDVIRYFMTIPEAVNLVLEAASIANGGEIFVLDMGQPVKIVSLAENLIRMYGKTPYKDVKIVFTGLRPGEKLVEELLMNEEGLQKTDNKLIFIGKQIEIDQENFISELNVLCSAAEDNDASGVVEQLHKMIPTFTKPEDFNKGYLEKKKAGDSIEHNQ